MYFDRTKYSNCKICKSMMNVKKSYNPLINICSASCNEKLSEIIKEANIDYKTLRSLANLPKNKAKSIRKKILKKTNLKKSFLKYLVILEKEKFFPENTPMCCPFNKNTRRMINVL